MYSMLPDGSGLTRLTPTYDNLFPSLSPDGTRIVFVSNRDNSLFDVYVMNRVHALRA
jgi:Tol biopolymer transport system component